MKTIKSSVAKVLTLAAIVTTIACNSGETNTTTSDTAQAVPGTNDSVPGVVNPGQGDTGNATVTPPTTNDHNAIMPDDSTTITQ